MQINRKILTHAVTGTFLTVCCLAGGGPSALADANESPFALVIRPEAKLLPVLHAVESVAFPEDGREYDYATKGYFKVAGRTVGRLPQIRGHADGTRQHVRLTVKASTRHAIFASARRHHTRRVTLTLVHQLALTSNVPGDMAPRRSTSTQHVYLTVPRG